MIDISKIDYSKLDRPEILMFLFHPRPQFGEIDDGSAREVLIPVEQDVVVGGRYYMASKTAPNILFFHGNGEIVADYEDIAPLFNRLEPNFLPVDYRGYGLSTGKPMITAMMRDCHVVFESIQFLLSKSGSIPISISRPETIVMQASSA